VPAFGVSGLFSDPTVDARAHGGMSACAIQSYYEGRSSCIADEGADGDVPDSAVDPFDGARA
jgi:hypothetical protein